MKSYIQYQSFSIGMTLKMKFANVS